ncbi:hypothetical protein LC653_36670 [Nostoc sp. CHAB 5784]|uniref:hypothetical protein n=1 Tax=Nostoc mirabile TaxID=2907820 RepID=UPI001E392043|nr:hypothetical protein [Nostoc mirabile]MCC5669229.1 hypothetical protein [Nostoc mirabile CHAB5784]
MPHYTDINGYRLGKGQRGEAKKPLPIPPFPLPVHQKNFGGQLNWNARYGNSKEYRKQVAIAHRKTHNYCVVCLTKKSEEIHHAYYGNDVIGVSTFPTCYRCHDEICHSPTNWIKNPSNPVWGNRNTEEFITRLRLGYQLLYGGIIL